MRRNIPVAALATIMAVSGCATAQMTPGAARIRVTPDAEMVRGCKFLDAVHGGGGAYANTLYQGKARDNARAEMLNQAAAIGANAVVLTESVSGVVSSTDYRGDAYLCPDSLVRR